MHTLHWVAAAALAVAALSAGPAPAAPAPDIPWRTDLEAARAEARDAGKPLLIVFR